MGFYVRDDTMPGRKREYLTVWTGPFASEYEGQAVTLPKGDGYMVTRYNGEKVRVTCPTPRTDDNFTEIDNAISEALGG